MRARAEAAGGQEAFSAWLDHARWLGFSRQSDREAKLEEAALERAAGQGAPAVLATDALLRLGQRAEEEEVRRQAFERAVKLAPDPERKASALTGLGELARGRRRESEAIAFFHQALAASPTHVDAHLALAREDETAGLPAVGLARLAKLPDASSSLPRVRLLRARLLDAQERRAEAEAERLQVFAHRQSDLELALTLARAARDRGDVRRSIALHQAAAGLAPGVPYVVTEWASLLEGAGEVEAARKQLEAAATRLPDEAGLWEELGRLTVRAGGGQTAVSPLRRALELRPQNPPLRRYLARLEAELAGQVGDAGDDLVRSFGEDGAALARAALLATGKADTKGASQGATEVLLDKKAVRVHRNGLSERFVQRLVLVRTEQAVRDALEQGIRYTPGSQEVEIRSARIHRHRPGATASDELELLEATGRDDRDLSEPWYGLYYDLRAEVVIYEGLRPGDVLELSYTIADVSYENVLRDYFGDLDPIAESAPRRRWEYILLVPASRTFHFNQPKAPGFVARTERRGDEALHRFIATDVPAVVSEPGMPGWAEVSPYLHVSTFAGWDEVGRWYWQLIADQLAADDRLKKAAREAVRGAGSLLEKVRALHRLTLESTRYVGLEFGIHGYKPYKVTQVLSRRFGDCKDKASLLHVFLREVGIESEVVLLRTRRSGRVNSFPASLAIFDHAVVYVPGLSLYLDGTAEFSGMDELPAEDQGVTVLRVGPRGSKLDETPVLPAIKNRVQRRWIATLAPEGGARIEEEIAVSGQAAPEWREHYETPGERSERFARVWEGRFPGAVLEKVELVGVEDRNLPVIARSVATVPTLAEETKDGSWRLPVSAREPDLVRSYARLSRRRQEFLLGYPFRHEEDLTFVLPPGFSIESTASPRKITSSFGSFELAVTVSSSTSAAGTQAQVRVVSSTEVSQNRISPASYAAFRAFLGQLDAALRQAIVVRKRPLAGGAAAPAPPSDTEPAKGRS